MGETPKPDAQPDPAKIKRTAEILAKAAREAGAPPAEAVESAQELANQAHGVPRPGEPED